MDSVKVAGAFHVNTAACPCRWVDEVVRDAPWVINESFIDRHSIDYVTHDALPYSDSSGQANDVYDFVSLAVWLLRITLLLMVQQSGMPDSWWLPRSQAAGMVGRLSVLH